MRITNTFLKAVTVTLIGATFCIGTRADTIYNKRTVITFAQPVEIPGRVLPAATYTMEIYENLGDRHIVRFYNADRTKLIASVLAIPNTRIKPINHSVVTFAEQSGNAPLTLKEWFYPGDSFGQEFVYPKARAVQLAQSTQELPK